MKKLFRNPDINWRIESHREAHVKEVLGDPGRAGEDAQATDMGTVTILAGGIMHQLNLLGGEIWKRCDGSHDRVSMVDELLESFEVERETLSADTGSFLDEMIQKGLVHEK